MATRTTITTVTFKSPFVLGDFDEVQPAGAYRVETDEDLLEGISFPAYRRTLTMIHLHPSPGHPGRTQMLDINPNDLDAALKRDQTAAALPADSEDDGSMKARSNDLEPDLEEMMADPVVRSVMGSDGLSQIVVWDAINKARARMAASAGAEALITPAALNQLDADRWTVKRVDDEAALVARDGQRH